MVLKAKELFTKWLFNLPYPSGVGVRLGLSKDLPQPPVGQRPFGN